MEKRLPKTWRKPVPSEIKGLPADVVPRWTHLDKIGEWEAQGYRILECDSEMGKKVKAGFKKIDNQFRVGRTVLMIARKAVKEQRVAYTQKLAHDRIKGASAEVDRVARDSGIKGEKATITEKQVEVTVDEMDKGEEE